MSGRATSHAAPVKSESIPVMMKRSGRLTEGAWASAMAAFLSGTRQSLSLATRAGVRPDSLAKSRGNLLSANVGDEASIGVFLGFTHVAAFGQLGIEMHRIAIGPCSQAGARR